MDYVAIEFIDRTIQELESRLMSAKEEATRKGWFTDGKKYQYINEIERHIMSLKRIKKNLTE